MQEALEELEKLKEYAPKEATIYFLIGKVHKKLGNLGWYSVTMWICLGDCALGRTCHDALHDGT